MTFAEIQAEVFRRLREVASAPVFWTVADVQAAINEGYAELSDATEWYERSLTIDLLNQRPWYDARTICGSGFLRLGQAFSPDSNRWLIPTSVRELDAYDRRWEVATDYAQRIIGEGLWWVGYWPRQSADTGTIKQYYAALPPALSDSADVPGFPDTFHYGLVEFALTDLWAQDGETSFALQSWAAYLQNEQALQAWVDSRGSDPMRRGYGVVAGLPA